jgi:putative redox protein
MTDSLTATAPSQEAAVSAQTHTIARATADIGQIPWEVALKAGHHALTADESPHLGGKDAGPAPFELVLAGLGACTSITLKMYAERKAWPLEGVHVELRYARDDERGWYERTVVLQGELTPEQRARIAQIAERTPVTLALKGGAEIRTTFA